MKMYEFATYLLRLCLVFHKLGHVRTDLHVRDDLLVVGKDLRGHDGGIDTVVLEQLLHASNVASVTLFVELSAIPIQLNASRKKKEKD